MNRDNEVEPRGNDDDELIGIHSKGSLLKECIDADGQLKSPGDRGFPCKLECNSCRGCSCSSVGTLIYGGCTKRGCPPSGRGGNMPNPTAEEPSEVMCLVLTVFLNLLVDLIHQFERYCLCIGIA